MSVIKWWLTDYFNAAFVPAPEYITLIRQMLPRFIKSTSPETFLKLLSSSDLLRRNYI